MKYKHQINLAKWCFGMAFLLIALALVMANR